MVRIMLPPHLSALEPLPDEWLQKYMQLCSDILTELAKWYTYGQSVTDDESYDRMFRELVALEQDYPHLKASNSPTSKVGA